MSAGYGPPSVNTFGMIAGLGKTFTDAYDGAKKDALTRDLGERVKAGDYAGAADVALQAGELQTGLALVKLGESRGASKELATTLGGLLGGGSDASAPATTGGTFGRMGQDYRDGGPKTPAFASAGGAMGDYLGTVRGVESNGNDAAKNPNSTATGRYQFTQDTWNGLARKYPDLGLTPNGRTDPAQQERAMQAFTKDNSDALSRAGIPITPGNLYVSHFLGEAGGPRFIAGAMSNPDAPATQFVTPGAAAANRTVFFNRDGSPKSAGQVYAERTGRFPGSGDPGATVPTRLAAGGPTMVMPDLSLGGTSTVAQAGPDAANMPVAGGQPAEFYVPPGAEGQARAPTLGRPAPHNSSPGGAPLTSGGTDDGSDGATAAPRASAVGSMPASVQLAGVGIPRQVAGAVGRAAPGSPERISILVRASLIPGLSEQQQGVVKTLLSNELEQSRSLTSDQKEYAQGLSQGFQGTLQEWKAGQKADRTRIVQGPDGQQYVVNVDTPDAAPRALGLPGGVRVWGTTGPDGQVVQSPPNVPAGTAGYYDEKGKPQLITGKGVSVTTNVGSGETEEAKELGKLRGKRAETIEAAAMKAPDQIAKLNLLQGVLERARTGTLAPTEAKVVGLAQSLGIPNETIANLGLNPQQAVTSQIATKLTNELVTGMIGGGGFPSNNFSNSDREFLTDIFPKISNRPEANTAAIEILKRVQQRNLEFGDAWQEYQQAQQEAGKPARVSEFEFNYRKNLRGKPDLFSDLRQQFGGSPSAGVGGQGGGDRMEPGTSPPPGSGTSSPDAQQNLGAPAPVAAPGTGGPRLTITPREANTLRVSPDTAESRQAFDAKFGAGAAQAVLRRPLPSADDDATLPRGKDRVQIPGGASAAAAIAEARSVLASRPDLKPQLQQRLRSFGISPRRLDE